VQLLAEAESNARDLRDDVSNLTSQLAFEQDRADDAERKAKEACVRFKDSNNARMTLQSEVVRLTEELRLYKDALEQAQREIFRAQGVIREVEERRRDAEEEAAKLRTRLRKINEEKLFEVAREEGRKQGLQEGLAMGKDMGYVQGRNKGYAQGRPTVDRAFERHYNAPSEEESRRSRDDSEDTDPPTTATTPRSQPEVISVMSRPTSIEHGGISRPRPRPQSRPAQTPPARTAMFSPANALDEIPHDGWIPRADASLIIRLPPPHELQRRTPGPNSPSPLSGSPNSPLAALPVPLADPLMVPEPRGGTLVYTVAASDSSSSSSRPARGVRRKSSAADSMLSTRTSELELLSAPEHASRPTGLSAIPEVASSREQSTPSSRTMRATVEDHIDEV